LFGLLKMNENLLISVSSIEFRNVILEILVGFRRYFEKFDSGFESVFPAPIAVLDFAPDIDKIILDTH